MAEISDSDGPKAGVEQEKGLERDLEKQEEDKETQDDSTNNEDNANQEWDWATDPHNPLNWPRWKKNLQLAMISSVGFAGSVGTSIISPSHQQLMEYFGVSSTVAFLPLSLYVLALGVGPMMGGPLSETVGRYPVYIMAVTLGGLFSLGSGLTTSFVGLCIMRFLAGFFYAPSLAIASGVLAETYYPIERGLPSNLFILSPFLGPGFGPVLGAFVIRKGWQWSQYTIVFFSVFCLIMVFLASETYHSKLQRKRIRQLGLEVPPKRPASAVLKQFLTTGLLRPLHMMFTEPIVGLFCLYVACNFGTLFSFFGAFFLIFENTYKFTLEQTGLVFLSIVLGCLIGTVVIQTCDITIYQRKRHLFPPHQIPPEYRLYPAMIGSLGLPVSLFWFAWTAGTGVHPAAPITAAVLFACCNICLFISALQYLGDVYHASNVASAASANSLSRYGFAAAFPLFVLQMYSKLGVAWATSLLAFVSVAMAPVPWLFFKYGKSFRSKSQYETAKF